jgi:tetratricopeptide (TPR) repeat protein
MTRILGIFVLVGLAAGVAPADVVLTKSRNQVKINGLPETVEGDEITESNWRIFVPKSEGVILEVNYDGIVWKKNAKAKDSTAKEIPLDEIADYMLAPLQRDANLDAGLGRLSNGNIAGALRAFQDVLASEIARPVDKHEANFMIGYTYVASGRIKSAASHFEKWNGGKSKWTPEALRLLAEIETGAKKYSNARATYKRIGELPNIPTEWQFKARCGLVKVDIAERKYKEAEAAAAAIVKEADKNADAQALALGLQAQAIVAAQDEARYGDAEALLNRALKLEGVSVTQLAFLNVTLGDCLYSQRKIDEARYPYLRVAELYTDERGYVGGALLNAGNCFIDMAGQAMNDNDQAAHDDLFIKGMKLIIEAGSRYGASGAKAIYKKNKAEYDKARARTGAEQSPDEDKAGSEEEGADEDK